MTPEGLPVGLAGLRRTIVMGVLNVTPDSFSDGGQYATVDAAIAHGIDLHQAGADIVDVGGESTRPGASRISTEEERREDGHRQHPEQRQPRDDEGDDRHRARRVTP